MTVFFVVVFFFLLLLFLKYVSIAVTIIHLRTVSKYYSDDYDSTKPERWLRVVWRSTRSVGGEAGGKTATVSFAARWS